MLGIIIQARIGSTRLKNKMIAPIAEDQGLFEFLLQRLIDHVDIPLLIATSTSNQDDAIARIGADHGIDTFRGSEDNVLKRFCDAGDAYGFEKLIRVCGDNPFLDMRSLTKLIKEMSEGTSDYVSFQMSKGIPAIKSHLGLYAEGVTLNALDKVQTLTRETLYQEHVTNYIYEHADLFEIKWMTPSEAVYDRTDLRFTVDTEVDLAVVREINKCLVKQGNEIDIPHLVGLIDQNPDLLDKMNKEIERNVK